MKIFKSMVIALVALLAFTGCEKFKCSDSHPMSELAGTWTCLQDGFAEVLVIKADGSAVSTGYDGEEYWENVKGNITVGEGTINLIFEDGDNYKGHFDFIPGMAFAIRTNKGDRLIYNYCKEDLSEEIVGMWVCTDAPTIDIKNDMLIQTFNNDGSTVMTGYIADEKDFLLNDNSTTYKVVGDLVFHKMNKDKVRYLVMKMSYSPNGTAFGDIMTFTNPAKLSNIVPNSAWLRVKQSLDLAGKNYNYSKIFVTNSKGLDQDFTFAGQNLNFSKMNGAVMDKMMRNTLFNVSFPTAKTISYNCFFNDKLVSLEAPIVVEGNKITVKMSKRNPIYRDIVMYGFQDADNSQFHMYMPTKSFTNFFANVSVVHLADHNKLDLNDAQAVKAVFDGLDKAIESINVSLVMEKAK